MSVFTILINFIRISLKQRIKQLGDCTNAAKFELESHLKYIFRAGIKTTAKTRHNAAFIKKYNSMVGKGEPAT